jgi:hypothetical protein
MINQIAVANCTNTDAATPVSVTELWKYFTVFGGEKNTRTA